MKDKLVAILMVLGVIISIFLGMNLLTKLLKIIGIFIYENGVVIFILFWGIVILLSWKKYKNNQK